MTLRHEPHHLRAEVDHARQVLRDRRLNVHRIIDGYAGRLSKVGEGQGGAARWLRLIENHYYEFVGYVAPRIVDADPVVSIGSTVPTMGELVAAFSEQTVNRWIVDSEHRQFCARIAVDALLGWGVAQLRLEARTGQSDDEEDPETWPVLEDMDTESAWWDQSARSFGTKRFSGFSYAIDRDDLIERAKKERGWNIGVVRALPTDMGLDEVGRPKNTPHRREVVLRELWIPDWRLANAPEHTNGTLVTLALTGEAGNPVAIFPRDPQPFFGPPWGPLYLYDIHRVPGSSLGMSPCEAVMEQVEELNRHANALSVSTARRKKIGLADSRYAKDADLIRDAGDGEVKLIDGFDTKTFMELELGGATAEQRTALLELRERLDRVAGMSDAQRSSVTGIGSPTEVAIANESSGTRVGGISSRFMDCDEQALRGVLWYFLHERSMVSKMLASDMFGEDAQGAQLEIRGGPTDGLAFKDFSLKLDRASMGRVSESTKNARADALLRVAGTLGQMAPMVAPFMDIEKLAEAVGKLRGLPELKGILHAQKAIATGAAMQQAGMDMGQSASIPGQTSEPAMPMRGAA